MTRFAIAVLGACALALVQAPGALALIQLDKGISGVRIGNTKAQVKASLGTPQKSRAGQNEFGRFVQYSFAGAITVTFQGEDRVSSVVTTGLGDRTSSGIGVGSLEADVKNISGVRLREHRLRPLVPHRPAGQRAQGDRLPHLRREGRERVRRAGPRLS